MLASTVEATPPTAETDAEIDPNDQEGEIRFALTSEAGLNDGLAFPFTYLAIAAAGVSFGATGTAGFAGVTFESILPRISEWFGFYVVYKVVVGAVGGVAVGYLVAEFVFGRPSSTDLARVMEGAEALAATLSAYAAIELVSGYGFVAVFVAALVLRHYEWEHEYYQKLHDFAVVVERLLMTAVLVPFGGALVGGLLQPLTVEHVLIGLALLLVIRPLAGLVGMLGADSLWQEQLVISAYGVRGIGSFFYLAYALNSASFSETEILVAADELWAFLGFVVVASLTLHGVPAAPVMNSIDEWRTERKEGFTSPEEAD